MSQPFDAGAKYLIEHFPADWLALANRRAVGPVEVLEADLSTVSAAADKVLLVKDPIPWILHVESQASRDEDLPERLHWYNAIIGYRHKCLVHSMVVLLRREADSPKLTGEYWQNFPEEPPYRFFRYQVVRLWQLPVDQLLTGGLGLLPLAPLSDEAKAILPAVIERMDQRLSREAPDPIMAGTLWTAAKVLMGLRYDRILTNQILGKVKTMKESVTYQAIVDEGKVETHQSLLLRHGKIKFGIPDATIVNAIKSIDDLEMLSHLWDRFFQVSSWTELLENKM